MKGINLSQRKYVLDILEETRLLVAQSVDTPMDPNKKLLRDEGHPFPDLSRYSRLVGKLNYLTITRLNISYAIRVVSQLLEALRLTL